MDFINQVIVLNELEAAQKPAEINSERCSRRIFNERNLFSDLSNTPFVKLLIN